MTCRLKRILTSAAVFPVPDEFPRRIEWIAEEEIEVEAISGCTARGGTRVSRLYEHDIHDDEAYCSKHGWFYSGYHTCPTCQHIFNMRDENRVKPSEATERGSE